MWYPGIDQDCLHIWIMTSGSWFVEDESSDQERLPVKRHSASPAQSRRGLYILPSLRSFQLLKCVTANEIYERTISLTGIFWRGAYVSFSWLFIKSLKLYLRLFFILPALFTLQIDFQNPSIVQSVLMRLMPLAAYPSTVAGEVSVRFASCFFFDLWLWGILILFLYTVG